MRASTTRPVTQTHLLQRGLLRLFTYNNQGHRIVMYGGRLRLPRNGTNRRRARDAGVPKFPIPSLHSSDAVTASSSLRPASPPSRLQASWLFQASFQIRCMINLAATFSTCCDRFKSRPLQRPPPPFEYIAPVPGFCTDTLPSFGFIFMPSSTPLLAFFSITPLLS